VISVGIIPKRSFALSVRVRVGRAECFAGFVKWRVLYECFFDCWSSRALECVDGYVFGELFNVFLSCKEYSLVVVAEEGRYEGAGRLYC